MVNDWLFDCETFQIELIDVAAFRSNPNDIFVQRTAQCAHLLQFTVKRQALDRHENSAGRLPQNQLIRSSQREKPTSVWHPFDQMNSAFGCIVCCRRMLSIKLDTWTAKNLHKKNYSRKREKRNEK